MKLLKCAAPISLLALAAALPAEQRVTAKQSDSCGQMTAKRVPAALDELVQADSQLGAPASSNGGMGAMFDDEAVLFAVPVPGFGIGKEQARQHLAKALGSSPASLRSTLVRAGLSADCKHGFTFGYTEEGEAAENKRLGKYVAYWVRRPDGWRIALFKLVPREPGGGRLELAPAIPDFSRWAGAPAQDTTKLKASLARREQSFSDEAQRSGLGPAFERFGSVDAVNSGGEKDFVVGNKAIGELHGSGPSSVRWSADGGVLVAPSGDLGVTWGMLHRNGPVPPGRLAEIPFFTIWRRASPAAPWLYVAE